MSGGRGWSVSRNPGASSKATPAPATLPCSSVSECRRPGSHRLRRDRACGGDGSVNNPSLFCIRTALSLHDRGTRTRPLLHPHPALTKGNNTNGPPRVVARRGATFDGSRGFQPTDGDDTGMIRRGATIECGGAECGGAAARMKLVADRAERIPSSLRDEMVWRDGSAAADGWKPTATFGGRSATKDKNQRVTHQPAIPMSPAVQSRRGEPMPAQAIGLGGQSPEVRQPQRGGSQFDQHETLHRR